jgi:hypothetical protein
VRSCARQEQGDGAIATAHCQGCKDGLNGTKRQRWTLRTGGEDEEADNTAAVALPEVEGEAVCCVEAKGAMRGEMAAWCLLAVVSGDVVAAVRVTEGGEGCTLPSDECL